MLRIGGSLEDSVTLEDDDSEDVPCENFSQSPTPFKIFNFTGGCLLRSKFRSILQACAPERGNCRVVLGLNGLRGKKQVGEKKNGGHVYEGLWDPTNARHFLKWVGTSLPQEEVDQIMGFEIGNELSGPAGIEASLTPEQQAADYAQLSNILSGIEKLKSKTLFGLANFLLPDHYTKFYSLIKPADADAAKRSVYYVSQRFIFTYHVYSLGPGKIPPEQMLRNMLNSTFLDDSLRQTSRDTVALLEANKRNGTGIRSDKLEEPEVWCSEGGGAYNSGAPMSTNAFVSGFWWIDQMGTLAKRKTTKYCRQTFLGGNYELVNKTTHVPNPDYFTSSLWNSVMGGDVHSVETNVSDVRLYVHVNVDKASKKKKTTALAFMNLHREKAFSLDLPTSAKSSAENPNYPYKVWRFQASGANLHSQAFWINGHRFPKIGKNGSEPLDMDWIEQTATMRRVVSVPPRSYGFVQWEDESGVFEEEEYIVA